MRITKLELSDYKCFKHLVLDRLESRVVLVGPNGCGKSAVLEAISVLKEYAATYNLNELIYNRNIPILNRHTASWPDQVPLPIRADRAAATITADFAFDEAEQAIVGNANSTISIRIDRSGEVIRTAGVTEGVRKLFRHFDPASRIGVIDYISPHRTFPLQRVTTLDAQSVSIDRQRLERIELPQPTFDYTKFKNIKRYIISQELSDTSYYRSTKSNRDSLALLREIFSDFFGPKVLLGCEINGDELMVMVDTPYGKHDLDGLSSGEKELFAVFVNLFRIKDLPSIILYDEPERHLNAGLETRVIPALDKLQTRNQLWMATHGIELIGSIPTKDIVALKREAGSAAPERFREDSKTERVRIFEAIGAKVGLQLASNRVVFLEGKNSHADKRIIDKLAGPHLPGVLFVASGSSAGVMGAGTRAGLLIEEASKEATFLMVLDRDFRDAGSVAALEKRLNNRVYIWKYHEVENLLLSPKAILEVLKFSGVETFTSEQEVRKGLQQAAKDLQELFICQWAAYRIHNQGIIGDEEAGRPTDEANLRTMVKNAGTRSSDAYSEAALNTALDAVRREVAQCLATDRWLRELPGKEILDKFRQLHIPSVQSDTFKEQIVSAMNNNAVIVTDINELCRFIKTH
jgi:predicted ATPase